MTPSTPAPNPTPPRTQPFFEPFARAAADLERLRKENADYRILTRKTLDAETTLITTPRMFYLLFAALEDHERRELVAELASRFCLHCGREYTPLVPHCPCTDGQSGDGDGT